MKRRAVILGLVAGLVLGMSGMAHGFAYPGSLELSQANENKMYKSDGPDIGPSVCDAISIEAFSKMVGEPVTLPVTPDFKGTWTPKVCYPQLRPEMQSPFLSLVFDGKDQASVHFNSVYDLPNRMPKVRLTATALMIGGGPALVYGVDNFVAGVLWRQSETGMWKRHLISFFLTPREVAQLAKAIEGEK